MALVDQLMGKPMEAVAPLTGAPETYQKAVQTSYDIAQNQERLRIADEQLKMQQQQNEMEFMSKGITALGALSKAKGKVRGFMASLVGSYFDKAKLNYKKETLEAIVNDPDATQTVEQVINQARKEGLNDLQITARLSDIFQSDPEQAKPTLDFLHAKAQAEAQRTTRMDVAKLQADVEQTMEKVKAEQRLTENAEKYIEDFVQRNEIPEGIDIKARLRGLSPPKQADVLKTYETRVGTTLRRIRDGMKQYKNVSGSTRKTIDSTMFEANKAWWEEDLKGAAANLRVAEALHNVAISGDVSAGKDVNVTNELTSLRKEANSAFKDDIDTLEGAKQVLTFARKGGPIAAQMIMGAFQRLREGKSSVLREGEINQMLAAQGISDRIDVLIARYASNKSEQLGKYTRQQYEAAAKQMVEVINARIKDKAQPFIETGKSLGADENRIKRELFTPEQQKVIFPEPSTSKKQEGEKQGKALFPTPSGEDVKTIALSVLKKDLGNRSVEAAIKWAEGKGWIVDRSK